MVKTQGPGVRYPCGKLRPEQERNAFSPAMIKRIVDLARIKAVDPLLATPLGLMRLQGEITDSEAASGIEYARLRGQADRAMGLPRRSAKSPAYEAGFARSGASSIEVSSAEKINARYAELRTRLRRVAGNYQAGVAVLAILDKVCVEGMSLQSGDLAMFRKGVVECGRFFGFIKPLAN